MSKPVVAVAFYSTYGHIATLADAVIKGVESTGAIVKPYCIQETLSEEILTKMHAGASLKPKYPVLTPNDLKEVDGVIFGSPTRYGRAAAQLSAFFDACGGLWATGALVGKFMQGEELTVKAGFFTSVAGQHGGHETTALTSIPFFTHMGMCYVPLGYTHDYLNDNNLAHGGAPWGASTVAAGDGSRQPFPEELEVAEFQGKSFATFVGTYVRGKQMETVTSAPAIAAKQVPAKETQNTQEGYAVTGQTKEQSSGETAPTTTPAPATTSSPAVGIASRSAGPMSAPKPKEKKGGLFASCCGGRGIEH